MKPSDILKVLIGVSVVGISALVSSRVPRPTGFDGKGWMAMEIGVGSALMAFGLRDALVASDWSAIDRAVGVHPAEVIAQDNI